MTGKQKKNTPDAALNFPKGFFWGTSTAAHQIEGGNFNNNWHEFEQKPGNIHNGDKSGAACDHWNRYAKDFDLVRQLNNGGYRMSIEWSRIFPEKGKKDEAAIAHYHKIIDALLKRKITPFVTLLHFTVPLWWEKDGGLLNGSEKHLTHFREFCRVVAEEFKEKIIFWNTINESNIMVLGYMTKFYPPGRESMLLTVKAGQTLMKMHAIAYRTVKGVNPDSRVGIVHNIPVMRPYNPASVSDRALAKAADYLFTGRYLRALRTGRYGVFRSYRGLKGSTDFFGLNYYNFMNMSLKLPGMYSLSTDKPACGMERLCEGIGWEAYPEGILINLRRINQEFPGMPIYVTENGIGTTDDSWRQKLLVDHLKMVHQAISEGIDIRGYFHWSLMDNFEWAHGFASTFGLYRVDFKTQNRTLRESGRFYAKIAGENALTGDMLKKFPGDIYRPDF